MQPATGKPAEDLREIEEARAEAVEEFTAFL